VKGENSKKPGDPPRKKPPRGRPPRHQGERLSKNRTFRVRGSLDEKLQAAAAASGRSVSEEIEFRLDQSFDRDAFIGVLLGGDENAKVLQSIAMVMKLESRSGHWLKDANTANTVRKAVNFIIRQLAQRYRPPPSDFMLSSPGVRSVREAIQEPPYDQTPESLAYDALERVRAGVRGTVHNLETEMRFFTSERPGNDGETK
jgi:hypothetical protein